MLIFLFQRTHQFNLWILDRYARTKPLEKCPTHLWQRHIFGESLWLLMFEGHVQCERQPSRALRILRSTAQNLPRPGPAGMALGSCGYTILAYISLLHLSLKGLPSLLGNLPTNSTMKIGRPCMSIRKYCCPSA